MTNRHSSQFQYAVSLDDDTVIRLMLARGYSPDEFGKAEPRSAAIHMEGGGDAFVFVRISGHENPSDNGFIAYLVRADSRDAAAEETGKIAISITSDMGYHNQLPLKRLEID